MLRKLFASLVIYLAVIAVSVAGEPVKVASFNVQFLGNSKTRDNQALVNLLAPYDLVFIQELVAPPYAGTYPDGEAYKADPEARVFFEMMRSKGFAYWLSEEDTGTGPKNHSAGSGTEWFVAFYKPEHVQPAAGLPGGFLAGDRSAHPDFERVPYAFPFRAGAIDLVFISVHLQPGASATSKARRAHELGAIGSWIAAQSGPERDYVVLGDMNIENCAELAAAIIDGFKSLNGNCRTTNTNPNGPKPYDHVMFNPAVTSNEIDAGAGLTVINLVEAMRGSWSGPGAYPGDPYNHNAFRVRYSDHHPVAFQLRGNTADDD